MKKRKMGTWCVRFETCELHFMAYLRYHIQNDEELNEILARGDDEVDIFGRMDEQRHRDEIRQWRGQGHTGPPRDRLFTEAELPEVYRIDPAILAKQTELVEDPKYDEVTGRQRRNNRTTVTYSDGLSKCILS